MPIPNIYTEQQEFQMPLNLGNKKFLGNLASSAFRKFLLFRKQ